MSRLPIEIRNLIWGYVDLRTAAGAFTIVTGEIFRLAYSLAWPSRRDISMVPGSQISVKTISVFGISYIQVFENKESTITVPDVVKRLSFITVLGGICAIKLFGTNWETDWLGKTPITGPTWYGTMLEIDSSLTCTYNVRRCLVLSTIANRIRISTVIAYQAKVAAKKVRFYGISQISRLPLPLQRRHSSETLFKILNHAFSDTSPYFMAMNTLMSLRCTSLEMV
jgi:hypothetical protein